jgi:hypothetical protein
MWDFKFLLRWLWKWEPSGKYRWVVSLKSTDILNVRTASIISFIMLEAIRISETSAYFTETTHCYIPEGNISLPEDSSCFVRVGGVRLRLWTAATNRPVVHPPGDIWAWRATVEWYWQGKTRRTRRKTCPSATSSATNPTWTNQGSNPGFRGVRPATNRLSHGTAFNTI